MGAAGLAGAAIGRVRAGVERVDEWQQRHRFAAFPLAVARKFSDDQAGSLAALLAYYALVATFPLLLVLVTVTGIVLKHDPALHDRLLSSALVEFPVVGTQLTSGVHGLDKTGISLVVGLVGTFLGARGLAGAAQYAFNSVWNVPYVRRPGFPLNLLRQLGLLLIGGLGVLATGAVTGIVGGGGGPFGPLVRVGVGLAALLLNIGVFLLAFRLATAPEVPLRDLRWGAVLAAVCWQVLLAVGGLVVTHYLRGSNQVYGVFGTVIGLVAWFGLQAQVTLYAVEADVVRLRRLYPRSLTAPPLTRGDERAYRSYAHAQTRVDGQRVDVRFGADQASGDRSGQPPAG